MRILIVEDDPDCRRVLYLYLASIGECEAVEDGAIAVACVKKSLAEQNPFSLICLDIVMPHMNGHEALKAIRDLEREHGLDRRRRAKVIMLTALGDAANVMSAIGEDCDAYIVKPVERLMLLEEIKQLGLISDIPQLS
ncbi:MAG: response regulator [Lentisphaerae bacterium]|nr:response regulator [Lentisphaerota bacterium]